MSNFLLDDLKRVFKDKGNALAQLILINVIVFLAINIIDHLILRLFFDSTAENLIKWLALPASLSTSLLKFWTYFSYMFLHYRFFHILFNMLWLYWMGKLLAEYLGNRRLVTTYLLGGLSGGALFMVVYNIVALISPESRVFNLDAYLLGASASVMAVVFATGTLLPNFQINLLFIGPVKLKYIALGAFVLTSLIDLSENTGGKIAHMGGALFGYLYIRKLQQGKDIASGFQYFTDKLFAAVTKKKTKIHVVHKRKKSDYDYNKRKVFQQQKIDEILDKISQSGYESLTKEEKEFLFKMSKD